VRPEEEKEGPEKIRPARPADPGHRRHTTCWEGTYTNPRLKWSPGLFDLPQSPFMLQNKLGELLPPPNAVWPNLPPPLEVAPVLVWLNLGQANGMTGGGEVATAKCPPLRLGAALFGSGTDLETVAISLCM